MDDLNILLRTISLTMGVAWASGINLYAAILTLGILGSTGNIILPPGLEVCADPIVIIAAAIMYLAEFFADKVPGVDTGWDSVHTFIRIPAGALLAASAVGEVTPAVTVAAALLGGGLAAGSHFTKAGGRIMINTSPEPFSNWVASFAEDIIVIAGLWAALYHPVVFLVLLLLFLGLMIWLLPRIWLGIKKVFAFISRFFTGPAENSPPDSQTPKIV